MNIDLSEYQFEAIKQLDNGKILIGGVGSGKSRTGLGYYYLKIGKGLIKINGEGSFKQFKNKVDLYIITTAKKRDSKEWEDECLSYGLSTTLSENLHNVKVVVDSWNNISKYKEITNAFFLFDEQKLVGSGMWVKTFLNIAKNNKWILLTATPGDTWLDYVPVFIANGFYKNRTAFIRRHVVYNNFTKFPKIDRYVETSRLMKMRHSISVYMNYKKKTVSHNINIEVPFDSDLFNRVEKTRWNVYDNKPIKNVSELCYVMRKVVNSDPRRLYMLLQFFEKHKKLIVFYNFDYERDILLSITDNYNIPIAEWTGHAHQEIPKTDSWIYLVQYAAGAEGWNCIETDSMVFYSQNYSYKATIQAAGRIDRMNTTFIDLYYYYFRSKSSIDIAIYNAFKKKKNFNDRKFIF